MLGIEGSGGSVESGGSGEVSSSSEVSETSAAETGGESSEATQEATTEEAGESGGFDEGTDITESPEDSAEDYEESDSDEEPDDSQEIGFSEGEDVENADSQYDNADYENDEVSSGDEDGVGFDDFDDDVGDGIDEGAESETEFSDSPMDGDNNEAVDETDGYDDDSSESDWDEQENDGEAQDKDIDSDADIDEADGDMDNDGEFDDAESDTETEAEEDDYNEDEDFGELEDYSNEESLENSTDDVQDAGEAQTEDTGTEANVDLDNDGELDGTESNTETDTGDGDDIDDVQDDGEVQTEDTGTEANVDLDNDGELDDAESNAETDTEADDYDEDEDPGELEDYSEEESLENSTDNVQDNGEVQTEDADTEADGEGDMDNDGELDDAETNAETDIEDGDDIDNAQDDGEAQTEDIDSDADGDEADGDMDNDSEPDGTESNAETDTEADDYDEDEDPGELEDYSDEDIDNRDEDESTDDSESELDKKEEEQAVEENQEAADRVENETENADVENADKNVDDSAESKNRNPAENNIEQQTESADANSIKEADTENDTSRISEKNNGEAQADGNYSFATDGSHRIAAAQEMGYENSVEVTNLSENANVSTADSADIKLESNTSPKDVADKSDISSETCENLGAFEQNKWDNLSQVEKEQAVEKLRDSIAGDLQLENKPNIAYYDIKDPGDYGGYAASKNTIYINRFNMGDAAETADTIAHESRHCWQHERADNPQTEQDYQFKENFDNYVRPEINFEAYQSQSVEQDARDYAAQVKDLIPQNDAIQKYTSETFSDNGNEYKIDNSRAPPNEGYQSKTATELPTDFESKNVADIESIKKEAPFIRGADNFERHMSSVYKDENRTAQEKFEYAKRLYAEIPKGQRTDINVVDNFKAIRTEKESLDKGINGGYLPVAFHDHHGLDESKPINGIENGQPLPDTLCRRGGERGNNLTEPHEDGSIPTMDELAVPYAENPEAIHIYKTDAEGYKEAIDIISSVDSSNLSEKTQDINSLIERMNGKYDLLIGPVSEEWLSDYAKSYNKFQNSNGTQQCRQDGNCDSKYGVCGTVAPMYVDDNPSKEKLYNGGAAQYNTPCAIKTFTRLGVFRENE